MAADNDVDVTSNHILFVVIDQPEKYIEQILEKLDVSIGNLKKQLKIVLTSLKNIKQDSQFDESITTLIDVASSYIKQNGDKVITIEILLLSLTYMEKFGQKI